MSPFDREIHRTLLPDPSAAFDESMARLFVAAKGTRSAGFLSVGMLRRNCMNDAANAQKVLRVLLSQQWNEPGDRRHGVWRTSLDGEKLDENWREFVGVSLIVALEYFSDRMSPDLTIDIRAALLRAAEGAAARDVGPDYTNIALMSAFLLAYVGLESDRPAFVKQGTKKAQGVYDLFQKHKTFTEYNSPTYYGVDLLGLSLWRELGPTDLFRRCGAELEADLWHDIGAFYHPTLKNMAGPYSRAYGMDMTKYTALTGLLIALAMDSEKDAPLPPGVAQNRPFEWAYGPMYSILPPTIPAAAMRRLREFDGPRRLERIVTYRGRELPVAARLTENWMMGAVVGLERRWEQHYPATIHWWTGEDEPIGWLRVHGESGVSGQIEGDRLTVSLPNPDVELPLRIQIDAPGISPQMFAGDVWNLPGMRLRVASTLGAPTIEQVNDKHVGHVLELRWAVPTKLPDDTAVLTLAVTRVVR
jgi:hypothetical protein